MKALILLTLLFVSIATTVFSAETDTAVTVDELSKLQTNMDYVWVLAASALVFLMQAGFMCLESGMARAKNSINVAIKNMSDFLISVTGFWVIGFGLMFGASASGLFGTDQFFLKIGGQPWNASFFVFQAVFCGTAATIISGAIAERTKFGAYLFISFIASSLIYPLFGHWVWGGLLTNESSGWLLSKGFKDFAGSSVVHSVGGWVALAGIIVIGPRLGRFDEDGNPRKIQPHNLLLVYLGTFILFFGWFGFNCGSTLKAGPEIAGVAINTILAACMAGLSCATLSWFLSPLGLPEPEMIANGVLGGLVAITAGCIYVDTGGAAVIGLTAGTLVYFGTLFIERQLKLDDVVGAVPVHALCGVWGTLAVGLFITPDKLALDGLTRADQIWVQCQGIGTCFLWAFGVSFVLFKLFNWISPMRVNPEDEDIGLNVSEHGATSTLLDLARAIQTVTETGEYGDMAKVEVEYGTEVGDLADYFNQMVDAIQIGENRTWDTLQQMRETLALAEEQRMLVEDQKSQVEHALSLAEEQQHIAEKEKIRAEEGLAQLDKQYQLASTELRNYHESLERNVSVIGEQTQQMESVLTDTSLRVENTLRSITDVVMTIDTLLQSMTEVSQNTAEAREIAGQAVAGGYRSRTTVDELSGSAKEIESVLTTIDKISDQTKLLALNATIEAARAGDAGRGFAVVAEEVQRLAQEVSQSTEEIDVKIKEIQSNTGSTVGAIDEVSTIIGNISKINNLIATSVDEQAIATKQIRSTIDETSETANEMFGSISNVTLAARQVSAQIAKSYEEFRQLFEKSQFA